ncbi:MAG: lytic transglycosylase domain-containing protein [Alphaproteobacteria bacterium]
MTATRAACMALAIAGLASAAGRAQELVAQLRGTAGSVPAVAPLRAPIVTPPSEPSQASIAPAPSDTLPNSPLADNGLAGERAVLTPDDILRYAEIFRVDDEAAWSRADAVIKQVDNPILIGHVLADRYLDPTYRPSFAELKNWLAKYADLPQADKIYTLALKHKRPGDQWPTRPTHVDLKFPRYPEESNVPDRANPKERRLVTSIQRQVRLMTAHEQPSKAQAFLESPKSQKVLRALETDEMRVWIANSYFLEHADDKAVALAHDVAMRNRNALPFADWTAGLAAWRLNKIDMAQLHFEAVAHSSALTRWNRTAGAYWAARANLVAKKPELVSADLKIAASEPRTFYGLLALRQLGQRPTFNWELPKVSSADYARALAIPAVRRAVALGQVGEIDLADQEMRRGHAQAASDLDCALISLSALYDLPGAQLHVAENSSIQGLDGALFPIPPYVPRDGFTVDRALLYAFMRQESRFKPQARSGVGAQGLMQIMPKTAVHIANDKTLLRPRNKEKLYDPGYNLALAQNYINQLMRSVEPRGNLFMLAAAYNSGPGNARRWANEMGDDANDPLMFIESIPARETRVYVERVLANLWLYRYRMNEDVPSLDQVAAGEWPIYDKEEPKSATVSLDDLRGPQSLPVVAAGLTAATLAPVAH